jgi:hypothetical protein
MDHSKPASAIVTEHQCGNLRHRGLYVISAADPDEFTVYDRYDATAYWCSRTQSGFGPDREAVTADGCRPGKGPRPLRVSPALCLTPCTTLRDTC